MASRYTNFENRNDSRQPAKRKKDYYLSRCCEHSRQLKFDLSAHGFLAFVLVSVGIGVLAGLSLARWTRIRRVENAVAAWNDPVAPNGWRHFNQLNASVVLTPPPFWASHPACLALTSTIPLSPANCPYDNYYDETDRFRAVKQLSLCALHPNRTLLELCNIQVAFKVQQPGSDAPTTLVTLNDLVAPAGRMRIQMDDIGPQLGCGCWGSSAKTHCKRHFNGTLDDDDEGTCDTSDFHVSSLAIKVQYDAGSSLPFSLDTSSPHMGPASGGANVLPSGYSWGRPKATAFKGSVWTYEGLSYGNGTDVMLFQIRSSSDPFLAYMAVTKGNGSFGHSRSFILALGLSFLGIGVAYLLVLLLCCGCIAWGKRLALESPREQPDKWLAAVAWAWGRAALDLNDSRGNASLISMTNVSSSSTAPEMPVPDEEAATDSRTQLAARPAPAPPVSRPEPVAYTPPAPMEITAAGDGGDDAPLPLQPVPAPAAPHMDSSQEQEQPQQLVPSSKPTNPSALGLSEPLLYTSLIHEAPQPPATHKQVP